MKYNEEWLWKNCNPNKLYRTTYKYTTPTKTASVVNITLNLTPWKIRQICLHDADVYQTEIISIEEI